eukprot:GFUD01014220.1.p1 GENE.GFUD01014220.1~~GFUD01014220.1.p1  ORF type:complete len:145 (-),score=55.15 GFUD01014220.1:73-444(-)
MAMGKVVSLLKLSTKVGLSGLAVYTTYDLGIWGNCKQGEQVFYKLQSTKLADVLPEEITSQLPEMTMPEELTGTISAVGDVKKNMWGYYNSGVSSVCGGLASLPDTVKEWGVQGVKMVKENIK